ncbi:unnamed protein product [Somion occarium]|uniref:Uncharacterized protein n=1 Tax=Somion occarium TaxID=3059160 RepID=A0ABP1E8L0_9APHY
MSIPEGCLWLVPWHPWTMPNRNVKRLCPARKTCLFPSDADETARNAWGHATKHAAIGLLKTYSSWTTQWKLAIFSVYSRISSILCYGFISIKSIGDLGISLEYRVGLDS